MFGTRIHPQPTADAPPSDEGREAAVKQVTDQSWRSGEQKMEEVVAGVKTTVADLIQKDAALASAATSLGQIQEFLNKLAAHVYETRTGDRVGAQHMLAIQPPGAGLDLAPTWLITDATAHSKAEHQRAE